MNKIKIKLLTPEMAGDLINVCSKYDCDINLYDGSITLDAKSIVSVFSISLGKPIEIEAVSDKGSVLLKFIEDMRKFEVKV